jgi:hypothetical protein
LHGFRGVLCRGFRQDLYGCALLCNSFSLKSLQGNRLTHLWPKGPSRTYENKCGVQHGSRWERRRLGTCNLPSATALCRPSHPPGCLPASPLRHKCTKVNSSSLVNARTANLSCSRLKWQSLQVCDVAWLDEILAISQPATAKARPSHTNTRAALLGDGGGSDGVRGRGSRADDYGRGAATTPLLPSGRSKSGCTRLESASLQARTDPLASPAPLTGKSNKSGKSSSTGVQGCRGLADDCANPSSDALASALVPDQGHAACSEREAAGGPGNGLFVGQHSSSSSNPAAPGEGGRGLTAVAFKHPISLRRRRYMVCVWGRGIASFEQGHQLDVWMGECSWR